MARVSKRGRRRLREWESQEDGFVVRRSLLTNLKEDEHGGAKLVKRNRVPSIGPQTHGSDECGLVAEWAEPENPAPAL
jgi:hypothetical protein